jgi:hypothetical protein
MTIQNRKDRYGQIASLWIIPVTSALWVVFAFVTIRPAHADGLLAAHAFGNTHNQSFLIPSNAD